MVAVTCGLSTRLFLSNGFGLTLAEAKKREDDVLSDLRRSSHIKRMRDFLWSHRQKIQEIVMLHFGLMSETQCVVEMPNKWIHGAISRKVFRCPMRHSAGEEQTPSASDERIRVEVANYAWISKYCPEVPAPHLIGFGLPNGHQFTHESHVNIHTWCYHKLRRALRSFLGFPEIFAYVPRLPSSGLDSAYMLLDCIESKTSTTLSKTWMVHRDDPLKRETLMRGLSRIALSLARIPLPKIGSFRFNDDGSVSLSNPPMLSTNLILEHHGAPRTLHEPYSSTGAFASALIRFRQRAFSAQPNAAKDEDDCSLQMAHLVIMRATMLELVDVHYTGPFALHHTDLHTSNIFVDHDWNVTGVIDFESVCSLPPDMVWFPYWFNFDYIDDISNGRNEFEQMYESYAAIIDEEQAELGPGSFNLASWMRTALKSGAYYFWLPFTSVNGLTFAVEDHILPRFGLSGLSLSQEKHMNQIFSQLWSDDSRGFMETKIADKKQYDKDLEAHYQHYGSSDRTSAEEVDGQ